MDRKRRSSRTPALVETPIAVRAYTIPVKRRRQNPDEMEEDESTTTATLTPWSWPDVEVIVDTETRIDETQRLTFGWYQIRRRGRLWREGPIGADDLSKGEQAVLARYVESHLADDGRPLHPLTRQEFADYLLWGYGWKAEALLVFYNAAFDLSRLAIGAYRTRGDGYKLRYWRRSRSEADERAHKFRPDVTVQALDAKRQFIRFQKPQAPDPAHRRPDGTWPQGNILDLHTLTYAFTDRNLSLDSAAKLFGCAARKQTTDVVYGVVDEAHIDYCRQDVRVTAELLDKLHDEYDRHPVATILPATRLVSPAALGKAYLRGMGVTPLTERGGDVGRDALGKAMTAYLGGRVETRIRRVDLPCVYADATSMYSSVFALTKLWRLITAADVRVEEATADAARYLESASRERLLDPGAWPALAAVFCRVRPAGHLLPVRAQFQAAADRDEVAVDGAYQIALTPLDSDGRDLWYALADLVACRILTGESPEVLEAFRVAPGGAQLPLSPVRLRGELSIDPRGEDFFQRLIEARKRADRTTDDGRRYDLFLKTMASAAAYGIFAEVRELAAVGGRGGTVDVWARRAFRLRGVRHRLEEPGRFCFPPAAATVTAAARLLLALLQAELEAAGGHFVAGDTDALLIVASRESGLVACPGGDLELQDGSPAIRALSWAEVDAIRDRLNRLNPYDRTAVPDLFKLEDENFRVVGRDTDGKPLVSKHDRVALRCVAISPKRYALFEIGAHGETMIRRASQHGLGYFLPPTERPMFDEATEEVKVRWTELVWQRIIDEVRERRPGPEPAWYTTMAPSQATITSWMALQPYRTLNEGRPYAGQIKPANFLVVAHDDPLIALPPELDRARLTPIAPYSKEPSAWLGLPWRNRFDGMSLQLTTERQGRTGTVRVKTYGDVVADYRLHPDPKMSAPDGGPVRRGTVGILGRRPVRASAVRDIGKEAARLEDEEPGFVRLGEDVVMDWSDPDEAWGEIVEQLRDGRDAHRLTVKEMARAAGAAERTVQYWLNGSKVPRSPAARQAVVRLVRSVVGSAESK